MGESIYSTLDKSRKSVRLIQVLKKTRSLGKLSCSFRTFNLHDAPPYLALSYTWGAASPVRRIFINGIEFHVRDNLYQFLVVYGSRCHGIPIWIDQICIDQQSTIEKNHQVQFMTEIYRSAKGVIIWLRPERRGYRIKDLIQLARQDASAAVQELHDNPAASEAWKALYQNHYWTRLWIVQEILLARELKIWYGHVEIEWQDFRHCKRLFAGGSLILDWLCTNALQRRIVSPAEAIRACYEQDCQDPRDKYYALHGLIKEEDRLNVDYAQPVDQVFLDAAMVIIKDVTPNSGIHPVLVLFFLGVAMGIFAPEDGYSPSQAKLSAAVKQYSERISPGASTKTPTLWLKEASTLWLREELGSIITGGPGVQQAELVVGSKSVPELTKLKQCISQLLISKKGWHKVWLNGKSSRLETTV